MHQRLTGLNFQRRLKIRRRAVLAALIRAVLGIASVGDRRGVGEAVVVGAVARAFQFTSAFRRRVLPVGMERGSGTVASLRARAAVVVVVIVV